MSQDDVVSTTVGGALRALRQAKGMSLEDVSARLKFSSRQIQSLEDERWDALPSGLPLRGMIRNYARLLGADPEAIAASLKLPAQQASVERPSMRELGDLQSRLPAGGFEGDGDHVSSGSAGWIIVILLVILAGLAYAFWRGWLPNEWLSPQWLAQRFHR